MADLSLGLADVPWRDGLIAWLVPSLLPSDKVDDRVLALLRSALPRWGGMGFAPDPDERRLRVATDTEPVAPQADPVPAEVVIDRDGGTRSKGSGDADLGRAERDAVAGERDELLHRLLTLCRSVPDECPGEAAAVCTVAAHVAWVAGDGAIARAAVERALRVAPDYRLAQLLAKLVESGMRLPPVGGPIGRSGPLGLVG